MDGNAYGERFLIAVDPGTYKCGVAVVERNNGNLVYRKVVPLGELSELIELLTEEFMPEEIIIGDGTGYKLIYELLRRRYKDRVKVKLVPERGTTLRARHLYIAQARNLWDAFIRFIRAYFLEQLDDLAAYVIAMDYLNMRFPHEGEGEEGNGKGRRASRGKR